MSDLVDQGKAADVIFFLNFSKVFDIVSHSVLDKLSSTQVDKHIISWMNHWLMGKAPRVIVNGVTLDW